MNELTILPEDTRLELYIEHARFGGTYISNVISCSMTELRIEKPKTANGEYVDIPQNTPVRVAYAAERGAYISEDKSVILGEFNSPREGYILTYPVTYKHVQRREFFRLDVEGCINYRLYKRPNGGMASRHAPFRPARFSDISGGGMRIHITEEIGVGSTLFVKIPVPKLCENVLQAIVVYSAPSKSGKANEYELGICYTNLPRGAQDQIIRWVFDKEREKRRYA